MSLCTLIRTEPENTSEHAANLSRDHVKTMMSDDFVCYLQARAWRQRMLNMLSCRNIPKALWRITFDMADGNEQVG